MATVLLCHDERLGRQVAVKRLHADSPADVEQRFVREARLGALLNHPNVVTVYDTATDSDGVLIVMEYVAGEALSLTLKRGPLRSERVGLVVRDLGAALDHLHAHGVVHRDVKPGNVLLRKDGVTKLVDLGIATAADQTRITRSGMVLGTASYMAPEQLEGGEAGPATDIYALSVVAYEALTGERARSGRTPIEIAHRIATEPPPDLRERLPGAPAAAAHLLEQGMARDPAERPGSAGELSSRLARALEEPAPAQEPPTAVVRGGAPAPDPPRPVGAIAVALVLLALAAAAAIGVVLSAGDGNNGSEKAQRPEQGQGKKEKKKKKDAPERAAPEEQRAAVDPVRGAALNDQGFALMQQGDFAAAVPLLEQAVASYPKNSQDIGYAYALFNLGKSLNRSGRPDEAIPVLERRLLFPNQRGIVKRELDLARANAG
jgi:serine/threonine-protein kinase